MITRNEHIKMIEEVDMVTSDKSNRAETSRLSITEQIPSRMK